MIRREDPDGLRPRGADRREQALRFAMSRRALRPALAGVLRRCENRVVDPTTLKRLEPKTFYYVLHSIAKFYFTQSVLTPALARSNVGMI